MVILLSVLLSTVVAKIGSMERFQKSHEKSERKGKQDTESGGKKGDYEDLFYMIEEKDDAGG